MSTDWIYGAGMGAQVLAWSWAFWIDGDNGASREFMILELISLLVIGTAFLVDAIRARDRRKRQEERNRRHRARRIREWQQEQWRKAE